MLQYFNTQIKPAADRLAELLDPFECEHENAEVVEVDALEYDTDSHQYAPTGTAYETRCDDCGSWYNELNNNWETL